MTNTPVSKLLAQLESVTGLAPRRSGTGWIARCPAHQDKNPSLSLGERADGRALVKCHAGCTAKQVVSALNLTLRDLMPPRASDTDRNAPRSAQSPIPSVSGPEKTFPTAQDAMAKLERQRGPRSAASTYHDGHGEPVGVMVRWDRACGGKNVRPVSRIGEVWIIGAMQAPRPLYHLPELAAATRVYITEGEKAADAIRELGLTATTSPHGSKSAGKADWSPLAGKTCIILPDADDPGRRYADDVASLLAKLTPGATLKRIELPDLPSGGDAVEYIAARRAAGLDSDSIRAELESMADAAESIELESPARAFDRYRPFPVEMLPEPVRSFVVKGAQAIGCDPSYIALPMLSALGSAIGNTRRIQLKRGWTEPPIVWTAIVGESGTLKTPAFKLVMNPIRDRQGDALKRHAQKQAEYETEALRWEKELAAWKRSKTTDDDPPEKPQPPQAERYIVSDATVEALAPILLANPRGILLARDELAGWIGSFDRYVGGKGGADAAHWLSMHNGDSIIVDRKTGQPRTIYVPAASVSIVGGVQPGILNRVLGYEHRESGLLARLLLAMPPRRSKRWTEAEIAPSAEAAIAAIIDRLYRLEPDHDDSDDPCPRIVRLTPAGKAGWIDFYNAHAEEHADLTGDLSAAWSKLEGYAARLALIVHCVRCAAGDASLADADAVDEMSITAGVVLSRWFGQEARRVYGVWAESEEDRDCRRLVELIRRKGGTVSVRDWQRARSHKTATDAEAELNVLVEAALGRWDIPPQMGRGRPTKRFVLASDSSDTDRNPADGMESGIVSASEVSDGADACPVDEQPSPERCEQMAETEEAADEWGEL